MQTIARFVIAAAALGALAVRFGTDSRAGAWSEEQEYAACGLARMTMRVFACWSSAIPGGAVPGADQIQLLLHDRAGVRIELTGANIAVQH